MFFLWVTTRHRQVGLGYGWTSRIVYLSMAVGAFVAGFLVDPQPVREVASLAVALMASVALGVSIARKRAGVSGKTAEHDRRTARVAAMTGIERSGAAT